MNEIEKVHTFIAKHHVLSFATCHNNIPAVCSLFYAYDKDTYSFIFASDSHTHHIQNSNENPHVAANIHLETKEVGKIQGLQIQGRFSQHVTFSQKALYFKTFPSAIAMLPTLYVLQATYFKFTDNTLGFGKKIIVDLETLV
jgi:uncharacterized protein YhbP (UPF0306 family)